MVDGRGEKMAKFQELTVWQKSMDLVDRVYDFADSFPQTERFGLWSQITRAAVSIPSNVAEGSGWASAKDCVHFLSIARGSLYELMTQLEIAERRGYGKVGEELKSLANEVARMLTRMLSRRV